MSIPSSQLETWSHQGAVTTAAATRQAVYDAIAANSKLNQRNPDTYLQGSYGNGTNVWASSDVDVVVQIDNTFYFDDSLLPPDERVAFHKAYPSSASYSSPDLRGDVLSALAAYFGDAAIEPRNKCIHVREAGGRQPADVVPSCQFRRYTRFHSTQDYSFVEGIRFEAAQGGRWITNYPKLHRANGIAKQQRTGEMYKPVVRMFKNARNRLIQVGALGEGVAPSYFLECLLYNIPDAAFAGTLAECYPNVLSAIDPKNWSNYLAQNERQLLFGTAAEQWTETNALELCLALVRLWRDW